MGRLILKPDRDVDFYVEWSTIVDSPIRSGPRAYLEAELGPDSAVRFDRADKHGSSSLGRWYGFDDTGLITGEPLPEQRWLPRSKLAAYAKALDINDRAAAMGLTEPIEDEDD